MLFFKFDPFHYRGDSSLFLGMSIKYTYFKLIIIPTSVCPLLFPPKFSFSAGWVQMPLLCSHLWVLQEWCRTDLQLSSCPTLFCHSCNFLTQALLPPVQCKYVINPKNKKKINPKNKNKQSYYVLLLAPFMSSCGCPC